MVDPNKRVYNNDDNTADIDDIDGDDDEDDDNESDNDNDEGDDDSTENLFLIKSKIINFYQLSYGQSGIPKSEGFFPARKRKRMTGQSHSNEVIQRTKMKFQKKTANLQLELWEKQLHVGKIFFPLDTGGTHDLWNNNVFVKLKKF